MKIIKESVSWNYFDKYDKLIDKYMPVRGEGETLASQCVTAVNKLIYKWYNDGDVFDNTQGLEGWANDLSDYANWLYHYIPYAEGVLMTISNCSNSSDYEDLLKDLADVVLNEEQLAELNKKEKVGSIYKCSGPFKFDEYQDDEEDEDW